MTTRSVAVPCIVLLLAIVSTANAQYQWQLCDTCYRNYRFDGDSIFVLGAIAVPSNLHGLAHDSLGIRLLVGYHGPTRIALPSTDPDVLDTRAMLDSAQLHGLKVIYPSRELNRMGKYTGWTVEFYAGTSDPQDSLQAMISLNSSPQGRMDTTIRSRDHVWGWMEDLTTGDTTLMVSKPRYTSNALADSNGESTHVYTLRDADSAGLGLDSTQYIRLTFTMTADSASLDRITDPISDNAIIAFGVIYRRDTTNQSICKCANYAAIDTVNITKGMLLDPNRDRAGDGYSNFHSRYYYIPTDFPKVPSGFETANTSDACIRTCDTLRMTSSMQVIDERDTNTNNIIEASERMVFRFYTTRQVPVRYLRTSISQHSYRVLKNNEFDKAIKAEVDGVYDNVLLDTNYAGFAITDEPSFWNFRAYGIISSKIQDFRKLRSSTDSRRIHSIVYANYGGLRAMSGDLDSTRYKLIQGITTDNYFTENYFRVPIKYANPDKMSGKGEEQFFRANADSGIYKQMIFYNDSAGYLGYLRNTQDGNGSSSQIGNFRDSRTAVSAVRGPFLPNLARAVDVSRYRNLQWGPKSPVYAVVTTQGFLKVTGPEAAPTGYLGTFLLRQPTAEEITVQGWLALNCKVDGIVFGHFDFDGRSLGMVERATGNHEREYGVLKLPVDTTKTAFWTDTMWIGFASRFAAVQRLTSEIQRIAPIYQALEYRREQMSVHDLEQSFNEIPMVDNITAERAVRNSLAFVGTDTFDVRDSTYLEVTHLRPGPRDTNGLRTNARYLVITNRRCWPIDHGTYTVGAAHGGATTGFGNIDVRRPWITLKNSTDVMADSFIVEKVGRESEWHRTIAVGKPDSLDWLEPGWGQLYRLRPVPAGVAPNGTAYNNAVHSVNPSKPTQARDRIVVYERDSIIYIRTMSSTGTWSAEWMISAPYDSVDVDNGSTWIRNADNINPAVAVSDDADSTLVVWERRENFFGQIRSTVQGCFIKGLPSTSGLPSSSIFTISDTITLTDTSWMRLTPAVVGIQKKAWVVAWAVPASRIKLAVVQAGNPPTVTVADSLVASTFPFVSSTASLYPTLAFGRRKHSTDASRLAVHLAWQQGLPSGSTHIFYDELRLHAGSLDLKRSLKIEHVCQDIPGCNFRHPSIATDAARTGVSFEIWSAGSRSTVGLRFRDSLDTNLPARLPWSNAVYRWGGFTVTRTRFQIQKFTKLNYERPSLTEFPRLNRTQTAPKAKGVLAWQWTNPPGNRHNGQLAYQFGWFRPRALPDGQNPSMMHVPFDTVSPYSATSVFYRGENSLAFTRSRPWMGTTTSYPGMLANTPNSSIWLFSRLVRDSSIYSYVQFGFGDYVSAVNCDNTHGDGLHIGIIFDSLRVTSLNFPEPDAHERGLSPAFFGPSEDGTQRTDSIHHVGRIVRTSSFMPDTGSVTIRRIMFGTDSLVSYLNAAPYDSTLGTAGNILAWLELVDANNGTVLWRGDTLSARVIADSGRDDRVTIPVGAIASGGTPVYIRMAARTTANLGHTLSGGFYFLEDSIGVDAISKRTFPAQPSTPSTGTVPGSLEISVIPNPARTSAELHLVVRVTGDIHVAIHDMLGQVVRDVPLLKAEQAGEYILPLDLAGLPVGSYLIVARGPVGQTTSRFTVDQ